MSFTHVLCLSTYLHVKQQFLANITYTVELHDTYCNWVLTMSVLICMMYCCMQRWHICIWNVNMHVDSIWQISPVIPSLIVKPTAKCKCSLHFGFMRDELDSIRLMCTWATISSAAKRSMHASRDTNNPAWRTCILWVVRLDHYIFVCVDRCVVNVDLHLTVNL